MQSIATDVLVVGGGATGAGVLRDLAMRGLRGVLVEKGDLTHGTTGRYHGLLHSGGRYVVNDPRSATECAEENAILRRIMPFCLEDTGGLFVATPHDDPAYSDKFLAGCRATGVGVQEVSPASVLKGEPLLNPRISRAFAVADAAADSFLATHANADSAREHGAQVLTYHSVVDLLREGARVVGVLVEDLRSGEHKRIEAACVLNAAGAWAGKIAALAGIAIDIVPGKGTMVAMNHRFVNTVINRLKHPADGDILVPIRSVCVIGTTDVSVPNPDVYGIDLEEIALMLEEGEKLVPGFASYRALRAWAGVRPLYREEGVQNDREISRTFTLLDHRARDGVDGLVSIVGGKWTTYRGMAQQAVDFVAARLGNTRPCRTHLEALPLPKTERAPALSTQHSALSTASFFWLGKPLADVEADATYGDLICECELVTRRRVLDAIASGVSNLDDVRRDVRMGMGPCQGGWCIYRTAALLFEQRMQNEELSIEKVPNLLDATDASASLHQHVGIAQPMLNAQFSILNLNAALLHFLQERWKGIAPVLWGDQLRQARLDELIYRGVLGADRLRPIAEEGGGLVTDHPAVATEYVKG